MYTKFYQKLVWQINNDIDSRMYSRRTKFIKYSQHLKWFERTLKNKEYSIYLVKKDKTNIGIIRQNKKKNKIFLSWALRRKFKGKNLGVKLVKEFIKKNNNTFFAEVHKLDIRSIKICKKIGFEFLKKEDDFLLFKKNKL
jgi:RimJ/RimL family protein N-acetyltransferase